MFGDCGPGRARLRRGCAGAGWRPSRSPAASAVASAAALQPPPQGQVGSSTKPARRDPPRPSWSAAGTRWQLRRAVTRMKGPGAAGRATSRGPTTRRCFGACHGPPPRVATSRAIRHGGLHACQRGGSDARRAEPSRRFPGALSARTRSKPKLRDSRRRKRHREAHMRRNAPPARRARPEQALARRLPRRTNWRAKRTGPMDPRGTRLPQRARPPGHPAATVDHPTGDHRPGVRFSPKNHGPRRRRRGCPGGV